MTKSLQQLTTQLTPQQMNAVDLLVENEFDNAITGNRRTYEDIAAECGITRKTLALWRKEPAFIEYAAHISAQHTASLRPLADSQLAKLVRGTSNNGVPYIKGLELYYKIAGVLVDRREIVYADQTKPMLTQAEITAGIEELAAKLKH